MYSPLNNKAPHVGAFYTSLTLLFSLTPLGQADPVLPHAFSLAAMGAGVVIKDQIQRSETIDEYWKDQITEVTSKSAAITTASITLLAALSSAMGVLQALTPGNSHPHLRAKKYIIGFFSAINLLALLV